MGVVFRAAGRLLKWPLTVLVRPYPWLNARVWDLQYALGLWSYLDRPGGSTVPDLIGKYARLPRILDLGCGATANLTLHRYASYHGVDISRTAIRRARALRRPGSTYEVADVLTYRPAAPYDVILLREVLYYFPDEQAVALLRRLAATLAPDGVVIVTITAGGGALLGKVRACGLDVAEELADPAGPATIVLRP
ncbi:class I SAM-dependent methyltransferase [Nonomuraea typhae]|uniref:class I SAM-dependent methyltransferase n=1 Tax=Nonomuraea typhae TaxID=2603600 RepID=UPI0012F9EBDF|nr:class I SAM-dependent methyltransferase [Nonomuraea typhae]